jgi:hypothetical protein
MKNRDGLIKGMELTVRRADPEGRMCLPEPGAAFGTRGWFRYRDGMPENLYEIIETGDLIWASTEKQAVAEFRIYHKL